MPELTIAQQITIWFIPVLLAITLHEAAHAWVAYRCGDTTAKMLGRLSFNPFRHIDPIGTILLPIIILIVSQFNFVFGWAKPVPINASQLHNPRRDMALATFAGPFSNLLMAFFWASLLKITLLFHPQTTNITLFILLTSRAGIIINLLLGFLNLIPIPPLDGGRVLSNLLPAHLASRYDKIEPYGLIILLLLIFSGLLGWIIDPPIQWTLLGIKHLFHL